jgi:hypothetical protein
MTTERSEKKAMAKDIRGGQAGYQGPDRQPSNNVRKSAGPAPDPAEAAKPAEVAARSKEAAALQHKSMPTPDPMRPGPKKPEQP